MARKKGRGKVPHLPVSKIGWVLVKPSNKRRGMERQMMRDAIRSYAKSQGMTLAQVYEERERNQKEIAARKAEEAK